MDAIAELEARLKKAVSRAEKAKAAFETASNEVVRLETTLSVLREICRTGEETSHVGLALTPKQHAVVESLKFGQNNAMSPADVFQIASGRSGFDGDVNYVRTTLWRMADKGAIGAANGTYWKFSDATPDCVAEPPSNQTDEIGAPPKVPQSLPWEDDDSDVPF